LFGAIFDLLSAEVVPAAAFSRFRLGRSDKRSLKVSVPSVTAYSLKTVVVQVVKPKELILGALAYAP